MTEVRRRLVDAGGVGPGGARARARGSLGVGPRAL